MSLWKGKILEVEIFGKSHAEKIGVIMKNFPKEDFDKDALQNFINRRKPTYSPAFTSRTEKDEVIFTSGVEGKISEDTVISEIKNQDVNKKDYKNLYGKPRPSHADLAAYFKDGRLDFSGGGEFSGRMTAPLCIAGGIAKQFLKRRGVTVEAYLSSVGSVKGKSYKTDKIDSVDYTDFPTIDKKEEMLCEILNAVKSGNSVGGTVECIVSGMKKGVGGELFDGLEGKIANLIYAIPAVKGVEFGFGFELSKMTGMEANDPIALNNGEIFTKTNRSGGINGGISNGMPITLSVAFRPTPSISLPQETVDLVRKEAVTIEINGRHDGCVAPRAVPVVEAAVSLAILDELYWIENQ